MSKKEEEYDILSFFGKVVEALGSDDRKYWRQSKLDEYWLWLFGFSQYGPNTNSSQSNPSA